ncbi:MAG: hypothetical protein JXE07_08500 [Candidatus Aminicenantes bacterium]|nr:hypothetical protein [Candidatus Aminicenantes bacterium]
MDREKQAMFTKKAGWIILIVLSFLIFQNNCKGPYTNEASPVIWVSTDTLTFSASAAGANPVPQAIQVKNSGIENLVYTITDDADWLTVSPDNGWSSGQTVEHTVSVDKTALTAGPEAYTAVITISSLQAVNNPQKVTVTLNLSEQPPPEISVTPNSVTFSAAAGGSNPPSQTIRVRNSGQGTLEYTISSDAGWLTVSPASGTSTGDEVTHTLAVNTAGLATGTYSAVVSIADSHAANSPQAVNVTLAMGTSVPPAIALSPSSLTFNATAGGPNPATQKIKVRNSGGGTLNYVITGDAGWMSVTPASGASTGQEISHTVFVTIAGLNTGTYTGLITVSSPDATNSPRAVQVTLVVGSPPTNNQISISCVPNSGTTGNAIEVRISILGNTNEIKAFGMDITYDKTMFADVSIGKGSLTGSWPFVSGSETGSGVRIGGFAGDPNLAIPVGSTGTIAILRLNVTCAACANGQQSQICMVGSSFTDDIIGMILAPGCATFTLVK